MEWINIKILNFILGLWRKATNTSLDFVVKKKKLAKYISYKNPSLVEDKWEVELNQ